MIIINVFTGIPLGVSKPHFLDVDPQVYARIEGMKPDERFRGYALLEPVSIQLMLTICNPRLITMSLKKTEKIVF